MKKSILAIGIIFLASCTKTVYVNPQLQIPPEIDLPTVEAGFLECLSDETYETMVRREMLLKARIDTLESIIRSTGKE